MSAPEKNFKGEGDNTEEKPCQVCETKIVQYSFKTFNRWFSFS